MPLSGFRRTSLRPENRRSLELNLPKLKQVLEKIMNLTTLKPIKRSLNGCWKMLAFNLTKRWTRPARSAAGDLDVKTVIDQYVETTLGDRQTKQPVLCLQYHTGFGRSQAANYNRRR